MPILVLFTFNYVFITGFNLGWNALAFQMMMGAVAFLFGWKHGRRFQRDVTSGNIIDE